MTVTTLDEPKPETTTAFYVVSEDGTVIAADRCVVVALSEDAANHLTDEVPDSERYILAHANPSSRKIDRLWWEHQERS